MDADFEFEANNFAVNDFRRGEQLRHGGDGRKTRSKSVFVKPGARGSRRVGASESTRNTEPDIAALTEGVVPG